jgi:CRP/FNR family transcriptional regulator
MSHMPADLALHYLGNVPYFTALAVPDLEALAATCRTRTLEAGESILLEGELAEGLYVVLSGRVRVFKSSPEGREQVLIVLSPGETFNDVPVFDGGPNPASADAAGPGASVCLVPSAVVARLLSTNPVVALSVTRVLASRLRHLTVLVEDLALRQIIQRVARLLLDESASGSGSVQLTHQEMAARVGTAREVVSRALRELERRGAISREDPHAISVDASTLQALLVQLPEKQNQ